VNWKRATVVGALATLVLATASSCQAGTVRKVEWGEDSLGNKTCTLIIQPNDQDSAAFRIEDQPEAVCNRCPVGAKFPSCNEKKGEPTQIPISYGKPN
jgi:hypothetical protein